jgi:hypothetical protein
VLFEEEKQLDAQTYYVGHSMEYVKVAVAASQFTVPPINEIVRVNVSGYATDGYMLGAVCADK